MSAVFDWTGECIGSNMALPNVTHKVILLFDRLATALPLALQGSTLTCRMTVQELVEDTLHNISRYTYWIDILRGLWSLWVDVRGGGGDGTGRVRAGNHTRGIGRNG